MQLAAQVCIVSESRFLYRIKKRRFSNHVHMIEKRKSGKKHNRETVYLLRVLSKKLIDSTFSITYGKNFNFCASISLPTSFHHLLHHRIPFSFESFKHSTIRMTPTSNLLLQCESRVAFFKRMNAGCF